MVFQAEIYTIMENIEKGYIVGTSIFFVTVKALDNFQINSKLV
jgi:hypothetical protein